MKEGQTKNSKCFITVIIFTIFTIFKTASYDLKSEDHLGEQGMIELYIVLSPVYPMPVNSRAPLKVTTCQSFIKLFKMIKL